MKTQKITNATNLSVYELIKNQILKLELKPGEIVTEALFAEKHGLSRTPVREAVQRLESEGLIISVNRTKKIYYLTPFDIENIFDLKIAIESSVARLATEKGTKAQLDDLINLVLEIRHLIDELKANGENETFFERWIETDERFHAKLFEMAQNPRAEQIIKTLNTQWHRIKMGLSAIEGRMEKSAIEHEIIGNAIISRDLNAAEMAVKNHLSNLKNVLLKIMQAFNF